jgi:hypothetical protein
MRLKKMVNDYLVKILFVFIIASVEETEANNEKLTNQKN